MAEGYYNIRLVDEANTMSDEETSDDYFSFEASASDETSKESQYLKWHQIREYDIDERGHAATEINIDPKGAKCDNKECIVSLSGNFALYLCYLCNLFLCGDCFLKHDKTHEFVRVESETDERRRMAEMFVGRMRSERLGRGIDFDREDVRVNGRVNVKHKLDKYGCRISGLSGLEKKMWVTVDSNNYCVKIFCSISNTLLRYIKFGSQPSDVTEMQVKLKSTDPDSASGSRPDVSVASRDEPNKQSLLAITFPDIKQIWFIDVNKTPAVKTKTIEIDKNCLSVDFSEDKIFALCRDDESIYNSIYILSKDANQLKVIHCPTLFTVSVIEPLSEGIADVAVHNGRVYYTNNLNERVSCINVKDGKSISELTLERRSWPVGISVDHNNGVVYLSGWNNKVYKLSPDLLEYEPLSLDKDYTRDPHSLCFINNKLYISHWPSSLENSVTVVQLLT